MSDKRPKRRWWAPEVIQTSAMDCGPAVLTSLLGGYGIRVDYGRLREACQVGLDGTAISTLESLAQGFGLEAEQVVVPIDHVLLPEADNLPAIAAIQLPSGLGHYVLLWRRVDRPLGLELKLRGAAVMAGGHPVLQGLDLHLPAGSHVAVVGPSGAGKSSLFGLLLGLHPLAESEMEGDGRPLDVVALRRDVAWLDPAVHLWSRSLLENLRYGHEGADPPWDKLIDEAELHAVIAGLPDGLRTPLGEGGGRLSGGEGQRVRLGGSGPSSSSGPRPHLRCPPRRGPRRRPASSDGCSCRGPPSSWPTSSAWPAGPCSAGARSWGGSIPAGSAPGGSSS